jgi:MoxR-like ATPase
MGRALCYRNSFVTVLNPVDLYPDLSRSNIMPELLKPAAEVLYAEELAALKDWDREQHYPRPPQWQLSPQAVLMLLQGGQAGEVTICRKYFGADRALRVAVATLTTDRALLLYGPPGTGKSMVAELLAAGICGTSQLIVQGTAGTSEEKLLYEWDYAYRLSQGTTIQAIVKTPIYRALEEGLIARIEELTRIASDAQDALITILSEKTLPIPELNTVIQAQRGFNIIATANDKDKGVNDLSKALSRRFNTVRLELPDDLETEVAIVQHHIERFTCAEMPMPINTVAEIRRVVQLFRELRAGQADNEKLRAPTATLSPAEAIAVVEQAIQTAVYFGSGQVQAEQIADGLEGVLIREADDRAIVRDYLDRVLKKRPHDHDLEQALRHIIN